MEIRKRLRHKWVIPVAALILVFAIGASAWATSGATDGTATTQTTQKSDDQIIPNATCRQGFGLGMGRGMRGAAFDSERAQEWRDKMAEKREAMLGAIRERMPAADQAAFDALLDQLEKQQDALEQAREAVRGTRDQIRDLIDRYAPVGDSTQSPDTTATTAPPATSTY